MKKLLLASVAAGSLAFACAPAHAEVELNVGGYFKGYGVYVDQDELTGQQVNDVDFLRDTELHIGGETTLDNGLTVGAHFEVSFDSGDASDLDESYLYFSGDWGRVNFGEEDGAAYLLQVSAPSADSNVDGIRQYIQPVNATQLGVTSLTSLNLDYAQDNSKDADKLTYLSPILSGFQVGVSYAPDQGNADDLDGITTENASGLNESYEIAARYEGQFQDVGVIAGAGYSYITNNSSTAGQDDGQAFNLGLDLNIGPFGVGAVYLEDNRNVDNTTDDTQIIVLGADYTTGPFKIGASYYNNDVDGNIEVDRYTGGVVYEYGPGMSFRGSISFTDAENDSADTDGDATAILLGTQVNF